MDTNANFSPHDLLPAPEPRTYEPSDTYFYDNVAKHLIKDTVRIMMNGLHIDLDKVSQLETTLDSQLATVATTLAANPLIQSFLAVQHKDQIAAYTADRKSKMRPPSHFRKPFDASNMTHRSFFMHVWSQRQGHPEPTDLLPIGIPKYPVNLCRKYPDPIIKKLLAGDLDDTNPIVIQAMDLFCQRKADIYNDKYVSQIQAPDVPFPTFNPASSPQKQAFFDYLGIEPLAYSKDTGLPSWGRDQIEELAKTTTDPDLSEVLQCFIDHSFAAIIRNNFIEAFYKYTIQDRLYGTYRLLGAKSGRFTSQNPNMLNQPSTGSIFAKPIKQCFTAPPGTVICAIDYAALEDRVMASLSRDANKCGLFLEDLDGHSLSATYYYLDRVTSIIGPFTDNKAASRLLKEQVDLGNKDAESVRQDSKPISLTPSDFTQ